MSCEKESCTHVSSYFGGSSNSSSFTEAILRRTEFEQDTNSTPGLEIRVERVIIRDGQRITLLCDVDDWTVQKLLGALTDEPTCFPELTAAAAMFGPLSFSSPASSVEVSALTLEAAYALSHQVASWVWIDLSARMVVQWLPVFHSGLYQSDDQCSGVPEVVYTLLPPDWRLDSVSSCPNWIDIVARRIEESQQYPKPNTQSVLWGSLLIHDWVELVWEFRKRVGDAVWESYCGGKSTWLQQQLVWLFLKTERLDLGGQCPQMVLASSRAFVDQACQYRRELWVHTGLPPQPRFSNDNKLRPTRFGTIQNRILVELFKYLLAQIQDSPWTTPRSTLSEWLACVEKWKQQFLKEIPCGSVWSRQELIELEQALMPIPLERVVWRQEQVMKQNVPRFEEVLGFDMSWDYPSVAVHVAEGKACAEQPRNLAVTPAICDKSRISVETNRESRVEAMEVRASESNVEEFATVWKHSYLNWDAEWPVEASYSFLVMRLSFLVSEVLMELYRAEDRWHGEELIERFSQLQRAGESENALDFENAANVFCELLEELTRSHPELVPRLADLQSRLWEQMQKLEARKGGGDSVIQ